MVTRVLIAALIVGGSGAVGAQSGAAPQPQPDGIHQVRVFETKILGALLGASQQIADRARGVVPDIRLQIVTPPRVTPIVMPQEGSLVFIVEAPAIGATSAQLFMFFARERQSTPSTPVKPTSGESVVAPAPVPEITNPEREYSEYVRQALIDVMLDNALSLPIKEGQTLTIIETGAPAGNPLAVAPKKLYLQMKGEDVIALRQNRITRDVAKQRILEERRY